MDLRKKLSALYVVGKDVEFETEDGEKVTVWIQKLSPIQKEAVVRRANAKRQAILASKRKPDNDETVKPFVDEVINSYTERDLMVEFLQAEELNNARLKKEEEVAHEKEWAEEDYLEGLKEAWEGDMNLRDVWLKEPDDPEACRVKDELTRFTEQVEERLDKIRERMHREYDEVSDEELVRKLVDKAIDVQADLKWLEVYRRGEIQFAVRDPEDHTQCVFESYEDLENLQLEVLNTLFEAYREVTVDPTEGKE